MSERKTLDDLGWRGGLQFARTIGRAKLAKTAPIYPGKWAELVAVRENTIDVWIEPATRAFSFDEIEKVEFTPQQLSDFLNRAR